MATAKDFGLGSSEAHQGRSAMAVLVMGALALSVGIALVTMSFYAIVPLAVAVVPMVLLAKQSRRGRPRDRAPDEPREPIESSEWYRREHQKRGHIVDDRVG